MRSKRAMEATEATEHTAHHGKSVLVVEDDADIRDTLDGLLRVEGYEVVTCANGLEALQRLRGGTRADVILLDLMMPVMDGWQFRVQQKGDPDLAALPVIAISADSTPKAAAIDADAYLKKPVDYDTLIDTIERTLLQIERKQLHAKLRETDRLTALGTLAAGVAHEINNPLAYVMANMAYVAQGLTGLIERAQSASASGEARAASAEARAASAELADDDRQLIEAVREAREGCERIRSIVRDLQLFSRPQVEALVPVDVRKALDSSINIVLNEVRTRARLVKDYGEVPPVAGNQARLGQVFLNLVLNAAQAIAEGNPSENEVRIVTRADGGNVIVEVHDTGEGIRPELRARIFDPFFTTKPVGVGTGLGLSISHGIVAALGGSMSVDSELGKGTVFRVSLPALRSASTAPKARGVAPAAKRARILVVDDEDLICQTLSRVLSHAHHVETTTHAREAIKRLASGARYDVIFCDLMMPELSGMDLHEQVQKIAPDQVDRIVFLTGGAFTPRAQAFTAAVSNELVAKPFDVDKLLELVNRRLSENR